MRRSAVLLTATATVLASALAGCSSAGSSGTTPPATQSATEQASVAATASAASSAATPGSASPSAASSQSAVATSLDPCQIVPAAEASAVAGTTFGAGQEEPSGTDGKRCVYGSETTNVFSVIVGQADTAADAEADYIAGGSRRAVGITKQVPSPASSSMSRPRTSTASPTVPRLVNGSVTGRRVNRRQRNLPAERQRLLW